MSKQIFIVSDDDMIHALHKVISPEDFAELMLRNMPDFDLGGVRAWATDQGLKIEEDYAACIWQANSEDTPIELAQAYVVEFASKEKAALFRLFFDGYVVGYPEGVWR